MSKKKYVVIGINVSEEERDAVYELAKARGFKITSDYIRHLILEDAKKTGASIHFGVDRGGWRGGTKQDKS